MNAIKGSFNAGGAWQENFKSKNEFEWIINHLTQVNHINTIIYKNKIAFKETLTGIDDLEIYHDEEAAPKYINDYINKLYCY